MRRTVLSALVLASCALAASADAIADEPPPSPAAPARPAPDAAPATRAYTLREILALSEKNHPNVRKARAELEMVRAQLDEAHVAPFNQFKLTGGVALAPEIVGSHVFSPNTDVSLTSSLGVAWRVGIDGVVPLWTFGKIGHLWEAAEANVKVHEAGVEKERDLVRLDARRAYFALQAARDGGLLLKEAKSQIAKAEETLTEKIKTEGADPVDLYELQTFAAELDARAAEAERFERIAHAGLRFLTGVPSIDIPDEPLAPPEHQLAPLSEYLAAAERYRPELAQARYGLTARESLARLAESNFYPNIGIGLSVGLAAAPEISDQLNPFVNDPANYFHYGAALVFQWNLDFLSRAAQLRQAEAQLDAMRATARFANGGIAFEVESAYHEVVDWKKRLVAFETSVSRAKKWLIVVQQGIDIGTTEDKDLIDPAKAYAMGRFHVLEATMELDVAMCKLAHVTGWDAIAPGG